MKKVKLITLFTFSLLSSCKKELDIPTPIIQTIVSSPGQGVTDIDGNFYKTIILGNGQEWMAENLRTTRCSDGTLITHAENYDDWYALTAPGWAYYENNSQFNIPFGKLYNWYAVRDCAVCPEGWRVPKNQDWNKLRDYLTTENFDTIYNDAGGKMKVTGSNFWYGSNKDANNMSGFSAYPGGIRGQGFHSMSHGGFWWSDEKDANYPEAYFRMVVWGNSRLSKGKHHIGDGMSIRCLKN